MRYAFSGGRYGDGGDSVDWETGVCGEGAFGACGGAGCGPGLECGLWADGVAAAGAGVLHGYGSGDHSGEEAGEIGEAGGDLFGGKGEGAAPGVDENGVVVSSAWRGYGRFGEKGDC